MMALDEMIRLLTQWEEEMTERWKEADRAADEAKMRSDFYHSRMCAARKNLENLTDLRNMMTAKGGDQ